MISLTASLAGQSHLAAGRVNQDSVGIWHGGHAPEFGGAAAATSPHTDLLPLMRRAPIGDGLAMAVADGHGSERYDRSDVGSALAVMVGLTTCMQLLPKLNEGALSTNWCEAELPRRLTQQWRRLVLSSRPEDPNPDHAEVSEYINRHGTTLIGGLLAPGGVLLYQIGDGEIILITEDLEAHRPVPERVDLLGAETESLSQAQADQAFRVALLPLRGDDLRIVMMASDGVTNSFVDQDGFEVLARQTLGRAARRAPGDPTLEETLHRAIATSSSFTGDDVSIAVAVDDDSSTWEH